MSQRFTDETNRVVALAKAEAKRLGAAAAGPEHLLLGLFLEEGNLAAQVLDQLGLKMRGALDWVERGAVAPAAALPEEVPLAREAREALSFSLAEAVSLESKYVRPEHVLLGLLRLEKGASAELFGATGITLIAARAKVKSRLAAGAGAAKPALKIPWERFTLTARRVVLFANEEAVRMGSGHVGLEHLLLGLVRERTSLAAEAMAGRSVGLEEARATLATLSLPSEGHPAAADPLLSLSAKFALRFAADEAWLADRTEINVEDLFLALLHETDGPAAAALRQWDLGVTSVRKLLADRLPQGAHSMDRLAARQVMSAEAFHRFDVAARTGVGKAQEEAVRLQSAEVEPGHLLLGLIKGGHPKKLAATPPETRAKIEALLAPAAPNATPSPQLAPRTRRILDLAADEARRARKEEVSPDFLVLALIRDRNHPISGVLTELGFSLETVRGPKRSDMAGSKSMTINAAPPVSLPQDKPNPAPAPPAAKPGVPPVPAGKPDPWSHYTLAARRIIEAAQKEAIARNALECTPLHVAVALFGFPEGTAAELLQGGEFKTEDIAAYLASRLPSRSVTLVARPKMSLEGQLLLSLAKSEADRLGHKLIGSPHLLLALLHGSHGRARGLLGIAGVKKDSTAAALQKFGFTLHEMRLKVWKFTEGNAVDSAVRADSVREFRDPAQTETGAPDVSDDDANPRFLANLGPGFPDWRSFTIGSRRALMAARALAAEDKRGEISTQDLLIALGKDPECAAVTILGRLGLDLKLRPVAMEGALPVEIAPEQLLLSKEAAAALRFALEEAKRTKFRHIGTEHLLLGLLRQETGGAAKWFRERGIGYEGVAAEMTRESPG